ncbi:MAG: hypothetical protein ACQEQ4_01225 [Fibrobacterota bacterium]
MMLPLFEPSVPVLIGMNILLWFLLHMLMAYGGTILPASFIHTTWRIFYPVPYEERLLRFAGVKGWKSRIPDGAGWFSRGVPKKSLARSDKPYLEAFYRETCRGELVHWAVILCIPFFFLFNPPQVWIAHILYGVGANIPCILIQRYNRPRIRRLLTKKPR